MTPGFEGQILEKGFEMIGVGGCELIGEMVNGSAILDGPEPVWSNGGKTPACFGAIRKLQNTSDG